MTVGRVRVWIAASADGFIAPAERGVAWLDQFNARDPQGLETTYRSFFAHVGSIIVGRVTYEQAQSFDAWPYAGKPTFVLSSRKLDNLPASARVWSGDLHALIELAKSSAPGDVWIDGGGIAISRFLDEKLVDDIEILTLPILLGSGTRLFPQSKRSATPLHLVDARPGILGGAWTHFRVER